MIKNLEIDMFENASESDYQKVRTKFIADYEVYVNGHYTGFFIWNISRYKLDPIQGEAEWNKTYPNGYSDWAGRVNNLTAYGHQNIINKINELVELINKV